MGKALYRTYRSRSLDEIVGQEHITTTLKRALASGRLSHAYLLTGPRGVGKTSVARILAHEINGLPYSEEPHLDIIEIDAASNRRIDEMRELRERVYTAPASAAYKVYIIDEVHMLTKEAFNALLKTLEEPPAHVVFILATTEVHKLPETIISRTQHYSFRPVPHAEVVAHLKTIAAKERIDITDDALALIAEHGDGSFRDSIGLLDQAGSNSVTVDEESVRLLLGRPPEQSLTRLLQATLHHDAAGVTTGLTELYDAGFEPAMIASQLSRALRAQLLNTAAAPPTSGALALLSPAASIALLTALLDVPGSFHPKQLLELVLLQAALVGAAASTPVPATPTAPTSPSAPPPPAVVPSAETAHEAPSVTPAAAVPAAPSSVKTPSRPQSASLPAAARPVRAASREPTVQTEPTEPTAAPEPTGAGASVKDLWADVLQDIKKTHNTLYGIARMAAPQLHGDTLTLELKFAFHQKRLKEAKNHAIIQNCVSTHRGRATTVVCSVQTVPSAAPSGQTPPATDLHAITEIFGGGEPL